jgi:peptide/nickel transport system substrate-binding protein
MNMHRRARASGGRWSAMAAPVLAVLLVSVVAGCGGSKSNTRTGQAAAPTKTGGGGQKLGSAEVPEVTWAVNLKDASLNVMSAPTVITAGLMANVAQGLVTYTSDGALKPGIASKSEQVSPTVYEYTLDPKAKFSDGKPVTQEDVVFSLDYEMNPKKGGVSSGFLQGVKSVKAVGSDKVRITLKQPDAAFKYVPGLYAGWIYEKAALAKAGQNFGGPQGIPIGSGPYMITEFTTDHMTFERNPHYAGPAPKVQKVVMRFITDDATRLAAIQSGDIDGTLYVPLTDTPQWEKVSSITMQSVLSPSVIAYAFNTSKKPFDDVHARRAMMYAFNRAGVVKSVFHDNARTAESMVAPEMWASEIPAAQAKKLTLDNSQQYPYDLDKAKAELAQSKYPDGFSTTVLTTEGNVNVLPLQVWGQSLKQLGIDLKIKQVSPTVLYENAVKSNFAMLGGSGGSFNFPDPLNFVQVQLCGCQVPPKGFNMSRYDNPDADKLMTEIGTETDSNKRVQLMSQLLSIVDGDVPNPTAMYLNNVIAVSKKLAFTDFGPWTLFVTPWMTHIGVPA